MLPAARPQTPISSSKPRPTPREFQQAVAYARSGLNEHSSGKVTIFAGRVSSGLRASLERRVQLLDDALRPGAPSLIAEAVAELLGEQTMRRVDPGNAGEILRGYLSALQELPVWAVAEAAMDWRRRDEPRAPTSGQLYRAARLLIEPFSIERYHLRQLLEAEEEATPARPPAPEIDPARRVTVPPRGDRIIGRFDQVRSNTPPAIEPRSWDEVAARLGVTLSDEDRAALDAPAARRASG